MKKSCLIIVLLLVLSCLIQGKNYIKQKRFYSHLYAMEINLPDGFSVENKNGKIYFKSSFSSSRLYFYTHKNFIDIYKQALKMGKGIVISKNKEVGFSHVKMLNASRGGYVIFEQGNKLTHFTILKKAYRCYILETRLLKKDFEKLRVFISSIKLLVPDETTYEGVKNKVMHRLTLNSDKTFRYSLFKGNDLIVYLGRYEYDNNGLMLNATWKIIKLEASEGKKLRFTGKFFFKKGSKSGEIRYSDVVFKHMTTEF